MKLLYSFFLSFILLSPCISNAQVTVNAGSDFTICQNDTAKIIPVISGTYDSIFYEWKNLSSNNIESTSRDFVKTYIHIAVPPSYFINYEYTVKAYNAGTMYAVKDTVKIRINPMPIVEITSASACQSAGLFHLDKTRKKPFSTVGGIQNWYCIAVPQGSGLDINSVVYKQGTPSNPDFVLDPGDEFETNRAGDYTVLYSFQDPSTGCIGRDTAVIKVIALPVISFTPLPKLCINSPGLRLNPYVNLSNGKWRTVAFGGSRDKTNPAVANAINNSVKGDTLFQAVATGVYTLRFDHTESGCAVEDSINITVNGLPVILISAPDTVCSNDTATLVSNYGSNGSWTGTAVENDKFIPAKLTFTSKYNGPYKNIYTYTNPLTGCTNSDSLYIHVQAIPEVAISGADTQTYYLNTPKQINTVIKYAAALGWWTDGGGAFGSFSAAGTTYTHDASDTLLPYIKAAVIVMAGGVCPDVITDTVVLVYEHSPLNSIPVLSADDARIYPVPAEKILNIEFRTFIPDALSILNSQGQAVYHSGKIGKNTAIDISGLAGGLYFLVMQKDGKQLMKPVPVN